MRSVIGTVSVAALVMGGVVAPSAATTAERAARLQFTASTSLLMPGTKIGNVLPPDEFVAYAQGFIEQATGQLPAPQLIAVPGEFWPATGLDSATFGQSVVAGAAMLSPAVDAAIADGQDVVIFGHSQSAVIATKEKQRLLAAYPHLQAGDVTFVLVANPNTPNGGLLARFPGLYIPLLDIPFNGATPTDRENGPLQTHNIAIQYDGWTDFPAYPLNLVAVANAVLGIYYLHNTYYDLPPETLADPALTEQSRYGDTTYYLVKTDRLPLLRPLRDLGVPDVLVDAVEPLARRVVELGYDRETPYGKPTPARLFPPINPRGLISEHPEPRLDIDDDIDGDIDGDDIDDGDAPTTERLTMERPGSSAKRPPVRDSLRAVTSVREALRKPKPKTEAAPKIAEQPKRTAEPDDRDTSD